MSDDLLPSNATPFERNLSLMNERIFDVPVIVKQVWNANTAPVDVLPWLAWALSVDDWDTTWTEEQKRNVIRNAPATQQIKGTLGAVQLQLASVGIDVQIQEWFNQVPKGEPYTYILHVNVDQFPLNQTTLQKVIQLIETTKNVRSHMATAKINVESEAHGYAAAVSRAGINVHVVNFDQGFQVVINDFVLANATITQ
jgi:phage tail P2-like protein